MKNLLKYSISTLAIAISLAGVSCQQPVQQQPAAAPATVVQQHTENGRYQIVIGNEGASGAVLFLLDTRDGGTWIYRPPSPPAFNGFWSDIPRLTYPPETWQQVFQMMVKQASGQQPAATPPASTTPPSR